MARRSALLVGALVVGGTGCVQITHSAAVRPGFELDVAGGPGLVRITPNGWRSEGGSRPAPKPEHERLVKLQINGRYGWRLRGGKRFLLSVMVPLTWRVDHAADFGPVPAYGAAADVYWQLGQTPDWGLGVVGSFDFTRGYAMIGHGWALGEASSFRIDGVFEAGVGLGDEIHALLGAGGSARFVLGPWTLGLWVHGTGAPFGYGTFRLDYDNPADAVSWIGFAGALVGFHFSGLASLATPELGDDLEEDRWPDDDFLDGRP